jgi:hypothetical protein
MAAKAQRDYYGMRPVVNALEARLEALSEAIPKGSVVLDIGCNDGTISNTLLERGVISKSYGFDLEDILAYRRPEIVFQATNIRTHDLSTLPDADGVLMLNVLHHVIGSSVERAKEIMDYMLDRYSFVVIDLGSFTENGDWGWRRAYDKHWKNDPQMWDFLFSKAEWRFKLVRYPTQGKGERTLWKLYKKPYALENLEILQTYRRVPEAWAPAKKMIPLSDIGDTNVVDTVEFSLARSSMGDRFWIKRYCSPSRAIRSLIEMELAALAAKEIEFINSRMSVRMRAMIPIARQSDSELIFIFEPDIFGGLIVHFQDWMEFFSQQECKAACIFATRAVKPTSELTRMPLINACDFQICSAWDGLTALDFEPNNWIVRLYMGKVFSNVEQKTPPATQSPGTNKVAAEKLSRMQSIVDRLTFDMEALKRELSGPRD